MTMSGSRSFGARILSPLGQAVRVAAILVNGAVLAMLYHYIMYFYPGGVDEKIILIGILAYLLWEVYVVIARNVRLRLKKIVRIAVIISGALLFFLWIRVVSDKMFGFLFIKFALVISLIGFFSNFYIAVTQIMAQPLWENVRVMSIIPNAFSTIPLGVFLPPLPLDFWHESPEIFSTIIPAIYFLINACVSIMKSSTAPPGKMISDWRLQKKKTQVDARDQ